MKQLVKKYINIYNIYSEKINLLDLSWGGGLKTGLKQVHNGGSDEEGGDVMIGEVCINMKDK